MIHVWQPNLNAPLRVWQDTTQTWQAVEGWQEVGALAALQDNKNRGKSVCLYFASVYLLQLAVDLNAQQLKTLGENGRRYLFEDSSIGGVDDLIIKSHPLAHPADKATPAPKKPDANDIDAQASTAQTLLYALHDADREAWMAAASLAGIQITALLPDFVLLPSVPNASGAADAAVWYQDADTQLLTYTLPHDALPTGIAVSHLPLALAKLNPKLLYVCGTPDQATLSGLDLTTNQPLAELPRPVAAPLRHALNFAQATREHGLSAYGKTIAALAMLALISSLTFDGMRLWYYQKAQKRAQAMLTTQYRDWFPNERLNPRLSVQRQLSGKLIDTQAASSAGILSTLSSITPILQQNQLVAEQLSYQNNHIELLLNAPTMDNVNRAVAALSAQGVKAKLGNASNAPVFVPNDLPSNPPNANAPNTRATLEIQL